MSEEKIEKLASRVNELEQRMNAEGSHKNSGEVEMTEPTEGALVAEYGSLSLFINSRRGVQMTINAITMTGTVGVLGIALSQNTMKSIAGFIALLPIPLIFLAWINWRALVRLDNETYSRLDVVELGLHIPGHHIIHENLGKQWLIRARYVFWDLFYAFFLVLSIVASAYLFGVRFQIV